MPEFLTERFADEDMEKLPIICGHPKADPYALPRVHHAMSEIFPSKNMVILENKECEMAKYVHNCFGALKVTYFNGVYKECERLGIDYQNVLSGARVTPFIERYHTQVPGPDGSYGFAGKCFPKDLVAFIGFLGNRSFRLMMENVFLLNRFYRGEKVYQADQNFKELTPE